MNPNSDDPLDALLRQAKTPVTLPTRFQSEVWQRIADRETASPWTPFLAWAETWSGILTRPRYALALVAVSILLGAGTAQIADARTDATAMQARYVNLIDPYASRQP